MRSRLNSGVALILTCHRIDCVEHRDVNNGHGAAGTTRPQLFAEHTTFTWRHRRVIQACGIDGDLIPTMHGIGRDFRNLVSRGRRLAMKLRAVNVSEIAGGAASKASGADGE